MDETSQRVARRHTQEPHDHQDYKDRPQHKIYPPQASMGFVNGSAIALPKSVDGSGDGLGRPGAAITVDRFLVKWFIFERR